MGAPSVTPQTLAVPAPDAPAASAASDPLAEFGAIVAGVAQKERETSEQGAHALAEQEDFLARFHSACQAEVRPAMQAVLDRLKSAGGGGQIDEHAGGEPRFSNPGLVLWMSFEGEIVDGPRVDRHPYLELDADVTDQLVHVSEGDMWRGAGGGRSGRAGTWPLSELTNQRVIEELRGIAQRAAA